MSADARRVKGRAPAGHAKKGLRTGAQALRRALRAKVPVLVEVAIPKEACA